MKFDTVFSAIEQMIRRLIAMRSGDLSDEIKEEMSVEIDSLDFIRSYMISHMTRVAVIIGEPDVLSPFINEISSMSRHRATNLKEGDYFTTLSGEQTIAVITHPTDIIFENFRNGYEYDELNAEKVDTGALLEYMICNRIYAHRDENG
ncbi:hypothetical protein LCGC14_2177380, partial [marine sediment metagenome]